MSGFVLGVDLGTGGPRVALAGTDGVLVGHEKETVDLRLLPGGGAEQDPDDWWRAILAAGPGVPEPTRAGQPLALDLPPVTERPLGAYALTQLLLPMAPTTEHAGGGVRGPVGGRA